MAKTINEPKNTTEQGVEFYKEKIEILEKELEFRKDQMERLYEVIGRLQTLLDQMQQLYAEEKGIEFLSEADRVFGRKKK